METENKRRSTVLIIDNDEDLLAALSTRIEHMGYRCVTARTGAQGLSEFRDDSIDLVITDMNMPVLDGASVIKQVRKDYQTPIIVVTGFKKEFCRHLAGLPDIQIIEKPFNSQDLMDAIESELYLSRSRAA